ncbi:hypothetical protein K3495_g3152 [Podosphaera aphanis]|nr:hypothetical protein K3495_g3152 [Podosphaera aphanis]
MIAPTRFLGGIRKNLDDERNIGRVRQLIRGPKPTTNKVHTFTSAVTIHDYIASNANLFDDDDDLQRLWKVGVNEAEFWRRARDSVKSSERSLPPDVAQVMTAKISECAVARLR